MEAPNQLHWSPDHIARFWDYWSSRDDAQETYFALQVGRGVVEFAEQVRPLRGLNVLDFGSGPGHLVPHLLSRGARVSAVDHSPNSISEAQRRFGSDPQWVEGKVFAGGETPWDDHSFDVAFCLETIEHLHSEDCVQIFDELHRVLKPGGYAVVTTPHNENLKNSHVYCPSCNSEFHRWQHLRSWSDAQLENQLVHQGYEVAFCEGLNFHDFQPTRQRGLRLSSLRRGLRSAVLSQLDRLLPRKFPHQRQFQRRITKSDRHHLAAIAMKPQNSSATIKAAA